MLFSEAKFNILNNNLKIGNTKIEQIGTNCNQKYFKFVGHVLDDKLSWEGHIDHISKKTCRCKFCHQFFKELAALKHKENPLLQPF